MWHTGSGNRIQFDEILSHINDHCMTGGMVYIGCDSQITRADCVFSTVICLHGAADQKGGFYFFKREKLRRDDFPTLAVRLLKEVEKSIEMGYKILEINPNVDIEIHIDTNSKKNTKTSKFSDMLMGYAMGAGFKCKIKPDAWASNSIVDKHSK